jgi:DDE superfamily endonuclease
VERQITADQLFNMDETAFGQQVQSKKAIAVKGSKNCWSKSANTSSHVTVVGCGSASGFMVPPTFITEGACVNRDLLDSCCVQGSKVTVSTKGFMTSSIFLVWLDHFSNSIHAIVKRPLILIYDGYGSHFNEEIVARAVELKIILVLLPSNATNILQPLDVAVFKPFKTTLKRHFESFMIENATTTFSKKDMIQVASSAWLQGVVEKEHNIIHGFKTTGIWPLSFPNMQ